MEFSKKMYIVNILFVIVIVVISFYITIKSGDLGIVDLSPVNTMITLSFSELSIYSGFMLHKSKCENVIKIAQSITRNNIPKESIEVAKEILENNNF